MSADLPLRDLTCSICAHVGAPYRRCIVCGSIEHSTMVVVPFAWARRARFV